MRLEHRARHLADARGQSLVEFSLVAFLAVMLLFGAFEMCRMVLVYTTIANAARAGARYAIVHGSDQSATAAQIRAIVTRYLQAAPMTASNATFSSTPSYPDSCTNPGCRVTVTVTYPYDPFVGYFPIGTVNLSSTSQSSLTNMLLHRCKTEAGQATILLVVALSIFLLGAIGFAVDGANLYLNWQMAQAAADAGAQAGIMSIFYGTNTSGTHAFTATAFTCVASDPKTPCYYAQQLNGFNTGSDTVAVDFPNIGDGAVGVNVSRSVSTTLLRFLGPSAATVTARGVAAIEDIPSAIPIIVTHPTLSGALSFNGTPDITIVGGGRRSIQVNSSDPASIANNACSNATVDLHLAGPDGRGGDFGDLGGDGQSAATSPCFTFIPGTGKYIQPAGVINDPLAGVDPSGTWITPSSLVQNPLTTTQAVGSNGCVQVPTGPATCTVYHPGYYPSGITIQDSTGSAGLSLFAPGLYYINSGGFNINSNGSAAMATGTLAVADPLYPEIGTAGMVVFNSGTGNGDVFNFSSNAGKKYPIALQGAPVASRWDGILFMEDPYSTGGSHTGAGAQKAHSIQGGGNITLTGTMYFNARTGVSSTSFQALSVQGGAGSTTTLTGEIITQTLSLGGNGTINI